MERLFEPRLVRPTSFRHTGVGGIRLYWDAASDGPGHPIGVALEGGATSIKELRIGAESRTTPLPQTLSWGPLSSSLLSHLPSWVFWCFCSAAFLSGFLPSFFLLEFFVSADRICRLLSWCSRVVLSVSLPSALCD